MKDGKAIMEGKEVNSMKRRPIFLLLAGVMVLSLAACSIGPGGGETPLPR